MPIIAFFGAIFSRIGQLILVKWTTGALKTIAIYTTLLAAIATAVFSLVSYANNLILEFVNGLPPIGQNILLGIAAFLPPNVPYLVSAILSYYAFSITTHLIVEVAKLKAKWAEKALGSFK